LASEPIVTRDVSVDGAWPATSPCLKVCQIDLERRCYGCGRTLDEIAAWSSMTLDQRRAVNARVGFRGHREHR
jgi:predicted Fe-S protein YdhL (DUF1289 family)